MGSFVLSILVMAIAMSLFGLNPMQGWVIAGGVWVLCQVLEIME